MSGPESVAPSAWPAGGSAMLTARFFVRLVLCVAGAACQPGAALPGAVPAEREVATDTVQTRVLTAIGGSVQSFVPAVAALDEGGECETLPRGFTGRDETLVVLSFPDRRNTRRNVSLAFDGQGRLLRYNDLRGDLRRVKTGPQTSIVIDWEAQSAIASNEGPGRHGPMVFGTPAQFLRQTNLGDPQQLIEQVKSRCGTP